jgi:hypothetical protein
LSSLSTRRVWKATVVAALLFSAAAPLPPRTLLAQASVRDAAAETFVANLKRAVDTRNRDAVSAMFDYPAVVFVNSLRVPIDSPATLLKLYDTIFTPEIEAAIAGTGFAQPGRPAPPYPVAAMPDGMSIAKGLLWIARGERGYRIARVNVPPASPVRATPREPTRIAFSSGATAKFSGLLRRQNERLSYLLKGRKGQVLHAGIDGFRGRDAVLHIFDQRSGNPVDARARTGGRAWTGPLPADADYRIDVVRLAATGGAELLYVLTVTLR